MRISSAFHGLFVEMENFCYVKNSGRPKCKFTFLLFLLINGGNVNLHLG